MLASLYSDCVMQGRMLAVGGGEGTRFRWAVRKQFSLETVAQVSTKRSRNRLRVTFDNNKTMHFAVVYKLVFGEETNKQTNK